MKILNSQKDYPEITQALITYLENIFPLTESKTLSSEKALDRFQGTQLVIDHLRSLHEQQQRE